MSSETHMCSYGHLPVHLNILAVYIYLTFAFFYLIYCGKGENGKGGYFKNFQKYVKTLHTKSCRVKNELYKTYFKSNLQIAYECSYLLSTYFIIQI